MTDRIPEEVLKAAHLKWCRRCAVEIMRAFAETGMSYADVEDRIGAKRGFVKRWLNTYMEGSTKEGREMTDLCMAMNVEPTLVLHMMEPRVSEQPTPEVIGESR